jgi:hypothetical protein
MKVEYKSGEESVTKRLAEKGPANELFCENIQETPSHSHTAQLHVWRANQEKNQWLAVRNPQLPIIHNFVLKFVACRIVVVGGQ